MINNLSLLMHLFMDYGLRSCEVASLEHGDVDFGHGVLRVRLSKNLKSRSLKLCGDTRKLLAYYIGMSHASSGPLFRSSRDAGKGIGYGSIRKCFGRVRKGAGIPRLFPRLLRHTFATSYIMGGGDVEVLRILMGHSDIKTTQVYIDITDEYLVAGYDIYRLDRGLFETGYKYHP